ncbi:MAG TPA: M50 family metallopeptidase [Gaiellaceae bacterium]|jgi:regulator of sigma E protease
MNVFVAIVGLGFLILIHEAGHFFAAIAVGMRPRRFYVGFPPAIAKVNRNGIEYGLGAVPLGGYVKIPGMQRPAPSDVDAHFGRALQQRPELTAPLQRLKRALASGDDAAAGAALEELTRLGGEHPPDGFSRGIQEMLDGLSPQAYWRQDTWRRIAAIIAGPATNFALAVALFTLLFLVGGGKATSTVDSVLAGKPAAAIGLKPGDQIVTINGVQVGPSGIASAISGSKGKPVAVTVQRGSQLVSLPPVQPRVIDGAYRLGFVLRGQDLGLGQSAWQSLKLTGVVTKEIGKSLGRLAHGEGRKDISSPVGITQTLDRSAGQGLEEYLWVLGLISLSLALMNMLPLLPLDGGHIAFSIVEGIRGRAVAREVYERVSVVGIALVLFLFVIGISNDVGRLGGG